MSLRVQLLQVARLAPRLLGDSTDLVRAFLDRQWTASGGARNRGGQPDLYYTIFTLAGLQALDGSIPYDRVVAYLESFGEGDGLDFVHLGALARCWSAVGVERMPERRASRILGKLEAYRKPDGGYEGDPRLGYGTAYGAFVALGAYQDLGQSPPHALRLVQSLRDLESADGVWSNLPGARFGATNATAGAITLIRHLGLPVSGQAGDWLLAQAHPQGGFVAVPGIPLPDLLSTATALHALAALERRIPSAIHERCLDFVDTLWSAEGGFHGQWTDDDLDAEYTFYGLLALGHLSL